MNGKGTSIVRIIFFSLAPAVVALLTATTIPREGYDSFITQSSVGWRLDKITNIISLRASRWSWTLTSKGKLFYSLFLLSGHNLLPA